MHKPLHEVTSNEYYAGLNRRFDRRVKLLMKLGYESVLNEWGHFFYKVKLGFCSKPLCFLC